MSAADEVESGKFPFGETLTLKPRFLTLGGRALLLSIVVPHTLLLASVVGQAHCCSVVTVNTQNIVQPLTLGALLNKGGVLNLVDRYNDDFT